MNVEFRRFLVVNVVWMLLVLHTHQSFIDAHKSFRPFLRPLFGRQHPPTLFLQLKIQKEIQVKIILSLSEQPCPTTQKNWNKNVFHFSDVTAL